MNRVLIHLAVPEEKRALAGTMTGLSGLIGEHAIKLIAQPNKPSEAWNTANGQSTTWWGASQWIRPDIAQGMLESGQQLQTQSWFSAVWSEDGQLLQHNLPTPPGNSEFSTFLAVAGLEMVTVSP